MQEAAAATPPPYLISLQHSLRGLGYDFCDFERDVLLLCAAMELDPRIAGMCARAHDDARRAYPTFALARDLFGGLCWNALSPDGPLRRWRLIEINQPGSEPLITSALRADERIVGYIKGINRMDDRLAPWVQPVNAVKAQLAPSQEAVAEQIAERLEGTAGTRLPAVELIGLDAGSNLSVAALACEQIGIQLYRTTLSMLPAQASELEAVMRLWERETLLSTVALCFDARDADTPASMKALKQWLTRVSGLYFVDSQDRIADLGRAGSFAVQIAMPTPEEQQQAWHDSLQPDPGKSPELLAGQFDLTFPEIHQVCTEAQASHTGELKDRLWDGCRSIARPRLDMLAQQLQSHVTLDDVVLPEQEKDLLEEIANQVAHRSRVHGAWGFREKMDRGLGISALFAGESGTGKSMAAEAIGNRLRLDVYRIDLSAVVNKYIGETEKNLRRLFDAAERGGAILFFDEADALFGKRSEVKDSHDRYANIEINYLLQRLEGYRGLAILATNMKSALDPAFVRRLRFIVNFPYPGPKEREAIWRHVFPEKARPSSDLDFVRLAGFNLSGANIRSIAVNAAFRAAGAGSSTVAMEHVLPAAKTELRKLDKMIDEAEFRLR